MDDIFYNINKIKGSKQDSINSGTNPFNDFDYSADQLSEGFFKKTIESLRFKDPSILNFIGHISAATLKLKQSPILGTSQPLARYNQELRSALKDYTNLQQVTAFDSSLDLSHIEMAAGGPNPNIDIPSEEFPEDLPGLSLGGVLFQDRKLP